MLALTGSRGEARTRREARKTHPGVEGLPSSPGSSRCSHPYLIHRKGQLDLKAGAPGGAFSPGGTCTL